MGVEVSSSSIALSPTETSRCRLAPVVLFVDSGKVELYAVNASGRRDGDAEFS